MASPEAWIRSRIESATSADAFPMYVAEGQSPPFVVYGRSGTLRELALTTIDDVAVGTFELVIYSDSYSAAKDIAEDIREELSNFTSPADDDYILSSHLENERDGPPVFLDGRDSPTFVIEQTFQIRWEE